ncbi:MAG TPA: exo-beta-N-acetylmuramidase NamZ domain-containing protein, partial [Ignavibacteriaceae bacterium]|nr:exo-beta-N-acetylmuramidase NamZ domain-containing protein [Ignavibacteriaceae bacterium]
MNKSKYLLPVLVGLIIYGCASTSTLVINVAELNYPSDLNVVSRSDWGWQPLEKSLPVHSINKITIHHSGEVFNEDYSVYQYLKNLQSWSRSDKEWIDIPYHFMIDLKGNIYEARPINFPGDTNTDYDVRGHALICVIGNYEEQKIIHDQLHSLVKLTAFLKSKYNVPIKDIKGHKDYTPTLCPGEDLYKYLQDGSFIKMVEDESNKFKSFETAKVKTGIEVLRDRNFDLLQGKKVGLVTNATGVDSKLKSTIDILFESPEVNLVALYGPEHGVRGNFEAGEYVDFYIDDFTQLPVYSLYGKTRKPTPEMLKDIDALVFDIQDIGSRSYTYISTMGLVMEAAAENNKEVIILDRPNPLGGNRIEGNIVEDGYFSFVSQFAIPYVHGLTVGELAILLNEEGLLSKSQKCKLQVVPMENWTRDMYFEQTGLPWILTSPHVPH